MEKYGYMRLASRIFRVLGWIAIAVSPLVFIGGIVGGAVAKGGAGAGLGIIVGLLYAIMVAIYGVTLLASSQGLIWMIDMEGHVAAIKGASQGPGQQP